MSQLSFDGREVDRVDMRRRSAPLSPVQRAILQAVHEHGEIHSADAGRIVHRARADGVCAAKLRAGAHCCPWVASDGLDACKRLLERGYLSNPSRGVWVSA